MNYLCDMAGIIKVIRTSVDLSIIIYCILWTVSKAVSPEEWMYVWERCISLNLTCSQNGWRCWCWTHDTYDPEIPLLGIYPIEIYI